MGVELEEAIKILAAFEREGVRYVLVGSMGMAMLGVIRILTGSVLLYIHVSCVGEALNFVGPHAWVDEQALPEVALIPQHPYYKPPEGTKRRGLPHASRTSDGCGTGEPEACVTFARLFVWSSREEVE